jgi:nuclear transport factor 2 (NTF2) superfamily protein
VSPRPPLPPFTEETARQKVQAAEDAWNTRDPERVAGTHSEADRRIFGPRPEAERGQTFPLR